MKPSLIRKKILLLTAAMLAIPAAHAATVQISNYTTLVDGKNRLTWGNFNAAQTAAGVSGIIEFDQAVETTATLLIQTTGITIKGTIPGQRVPVTHKFDADGLADTFTEPIDWTTTTSREDTALINAVPQSMIDSQAKNRAVFRIKADDVKLEQLIIEGSDWPLVKSNVAISGGTRIAQGVEMGVEVKDGHKNISIQNTTIQKVNVCINLDRAELPHGLKIQGGHYYGGRGFINSADEENGTLLLETSLTAPMTINNALVGSHIARNKNFFPARGLTFDYGNNLFANGPVNSTQGVIDFKGSYITNSTMGPFTSFAIDFNRCRNIDIGKAGEGNVVEAGIYRASFVQCIHLESGSRDLRIRDNELIINTVNAEPIISSSIVIGTLGHNTQEPVTDVLMENNTYKGYPERLVSGHILGWEFKNETIDIAAGHSLINTVNTWPYPRAAANHRVTGTAANNDLKIDDTSDRAYFNFTFRNGDDAKNVEFQAEIFVADQDNNRTGGTVRDLGDKVGFIKNGGWITFKDFEMGDASYLTVRASAGSGAAGGTIEFRKGSATGNLVAEVTIDASQSNNWTDFVPFTTNIVNERDSIYDLYVVFKKPAGVTGNPFLFDLDSFTFISSEQFQAETFDLDHDNNPLVAPVRDLTTHVGYIRNNNWIRFQDVTIGNHINTISIHAASGGAGGSIEFREGSPTGSLIGEVTIDASQSQNWSDFVEFQTSSLNSYSLTPFDLYLVFKKPAGAAGDPYLFDVDRFTFDTDL